MSEHQVFISYSNHDEQTAKRVFQALTSANLNVWMAPDSLKPGMGFPGQIAAAIKQTRIFLLVFSSHANGSKHVNHEVTLADNSATDRGFILHGREEYFPCAELHHHTASQLLGLFEELEPARANGSGYEVFGDLQQRLSALLAQFPRVDRNTARDLAYALYEESHPFVSAQLP